MSQHRRMADPQTCSTPGCGHEAAYTTRKRPAWCESCLADILGMGGLTPVAPFPGNPKRYWRTRCNRCGVVADYRLEYVLDKNAYAEPTCRVCYWIEWAGGVQSDVIPDEDIRALADENGYDLATLVLPQTRSSEPVVLRCRACDKLKVSRVLDIHWGCECSRAKRRAEEEAARLAKKRVQRGFPPSSGGITTETRPPCSPPSSRRRRRLCGGWDRRASTASNAPSPLWPPRRSVRRAERPASR